MAKDAPGSAKEDEVVDDESALDQVNKILNEKGGMA